MLSPREKWIINMRFGREDGSERSLQELGRVFSVARERIPRIEAEALKEPPAPVSFAAVPGFSRGREARHLAGLYRSLGEEE